MPTVRAIKSFVWQLRDIDVGDVVDVSERDAFLLVHGYQHAVRVDEGDAGPPVPSAMVTHNDPVVEHRDPSVRRRGKS